MATRNIEKYKKRILAEKTQLEADRARLKELRNGFGADGDQADEAQLSVGELRQALERFAPDARRKKR